eukprot:comp8996_c0_seq1/m.10204 comp8996_c0_seq1/g.10204  ORF comp8996_c0_seq1/g.10204 comp8996_c0_seq1/m.10204 type:complete len:322 (-) comp8996_c0_seq1:1449-2414(-)
MQARDKLLVLGVDLALHDHCCDQRPRDERECNQNDQTCEECIHRGAACLLLVGEHEREMHCLDAARGVDCLHACIVGARHCNGRREERGAVVDRSIGELDWIRQCRAVHKKRTPERRCLLEPLVEQKLGNRRSIQGTDALGGALCVDKHGCHRVCEIGKDPSGPNGLLDIVVVDECAVLQEAERLGVLLANHSGTHESKAENQRDRGNQKHKDQSAAVARSHACALDEAGLELLPEQPRGSIHALQIARPVFVRGARADIDTAQRQRRGCAAVLARGRSRRRTVVRVLHLARLRHVASSRRRRWAALAARSRGVALAIGCI